MLIANESLQGQCRGRILFVLGGAMDVGGAELQLMALAPGLLREGFQVELLCLWKRGALADRLESLGVPVLSIPPSIGERGGPLAKIKRLLAGFVAVRRAIRRWRPDIIHFVLPHAYVVGGFAALTARGPCLVMSRRGLNRYLDGRPLARLQEAFLHHRMDVLLGNSRAVCRELLAEGGDPRRVGLIYNGIDMAVSAGQPDMAEARRRLGLPQEGLLLVKVANLWSYKGHADLLDALARASLGGSWRLLLAGRDEGAGEALREKAARLGIADRVSFLGDVEEVPLWLAAADIGVSASHEEGFSNAVLEYLAAGLPTVVTDVGGNAEAVGDAGVVVPPADVDALANGLQRLADVEVRTTLAGQARQRATLFDMASCIRRHQLLYQALLDGHGLPAELRAEG